MRFLNLYVKEIFFSISIIILCLLDLNLYSLIEINYPLSKFWGFYQKALLVIISLILFILYNGWKNCPSLLKIYLIIVCSSMTMIYMYSSINYPSNELYNIILQSNQFFLIFLSFPLYKFFIKQKGYYHIFNLLNIVVFIWYILCIAQSVTYSVTGTLFLNVFENIRNNSLRIDLIGIPNIMFLYNFCQVFYNKENKSKLFNIVQLLLGLYCIVFIQQTRAYYIVFICSILAIIVFYRRMTVVRLFFILSCLIFISYYAINSGFLDSFGPNSEDYGSTVARLGAYSYFWNSFLHNPLFGHGIIASVDLLSISTGPYGIYFYADVGFVGALAQYGVFILLLYVLPILYGIVSVYKRIQSRNVDPFAIGFLMYVIVSSSTLLCTNDMRSFLWPFFIAFLAYESSVITK